VAKSSHQRKRNSPPLSKALSNRWQELCARYLPIVPPDSIWRYSRARTILDLEQGWKLHLSATTLTAHRVLEAVGPFLQSHSVLFKGPASLQELNKLNGGIYYGYTQVGKCFTIYPQTAEEAVTLADRLHELTKGMAAPAVPFDLRYRPDSSVYYRYGAFQHQEIENEDGTVTLALHNPEGKLIPDLRESRAAKPDWVSDPFLEKRTLPDTTQPIQSPLKTTFRVFRALSQRGKGGVYQGVDFSVQPPRLCVLKEGRRAGEADWDGRDGCHRVEHEKRVLRALSALEIEVPRIYASFNLEGNFYLVTEFIEGDNLQKLLNRRERRLPVSRALQYGLQVSTLLSQIHAGGWVWGDCKPSNLILTRERALRPLDFESAGRVGQRRAMNWCTLAFAPPRDDKRPRRLSETSDDLYALGVTIYYLLSGSLPSTPVPTPVEKLRRNVPPAARQIVSELMSHNAQRRPNARVVARRLKVLLSLRDANCAKIARAAMA
jgi:hypothetical protein